MTKTNSAPAPESFLPLTSAAFHVLLALASSDKHGWAIKKEVASSTEGELTLGPGTLYGLLKRLLARELVAESDDRPPFEWDDERRRYYRLTRLGDAVLRAEVHRMERAAARARSRGVEPGVTRA